MIEPLNLNITISRQCELLNLNRSTYYYQPAPIAPEDLERMNLIDEIYTKYPYYGSPKITAEMRRRGILINHKAVERLMNEMGIKAIIPRKNTSQARIQDFHYPYLLNGLNINYPNQVWGTDITYVRAHKIWFYLVAIIDWYSRYVIAWRLSPNLTSLFCQENLQEALMKAVPRIHNSDQGSQFTANEYTKILLEKNIKISMDARGRCFDNIFTERLWRTVKYEEIYLHNYGSYQEAKESLKEYFQIYNYERIHQSLNYQTPAEIYFA